jgi:two-component system, cell cycle sensor histidine kinase and response regulator CckA
MHILQLMSGVLAAALGHAAAFEAERRKVAEQTAELKANEDRFAAFMNNSPVIAFVKDGEGRYTYVNEPFLKLFGIGPEDWYGRTDADFFSPETARQLRERDLAVMAGGSPVRCEERVPTPDGVERCWLSCKFPFRNGGGKRCLGGMALDITDRKRSEEELRLRDRAIESFVQGVCITDACQDDNPIIHVNRGFLEITGYSREEVLGRNCRFLKGPKTDPAALEQVREAVRAGRSCVVELLNYRRDGTTFWNALSLSPVHDEAGRLTHFVSVQTDITPLKRLEEQFLQAQKMEAVGRLAGGVAHDFNNLLTIVSGCSEVLLDMLPPGDASRELIEEVHRAGERGAALTRQLLAFSRQQVVETQVLNLNDIVVSTKKMLRRLIGEDVELTTATAPKLWPVKADAGQISQIMLNLAINARDAMPDGGSLTIETASVELTGLEPMLPAEATPGRYVLLTIRDTGCGMSPEVRSRIFDPFFTTKGPGKGTGLGLATVFGCVRQSGGFLSVDSEPGEGATFRIYFPSCRPTDTAGDAARQALHTPPPGSETILVAEDETAVRSIILMTLRSQGYTVLEAEQGNEALRVFDEHEGPVHLLVTDVVMPGMGGGELAERLTARRPELKVLYLSGYTDDRVTRHDVQGDRSDFMQKPFSPKKLAARVREILDRQQPPPPVPAAGTSAAPVRL